MVCLYTDNPKNATRKLLELIDVFGKFEGYKINTWNLLHFYTLTTENQKEKLRKQFYFTMTSRRRKYLGINLSKKAKYLENYKMPVKEIKDHTNRRRAIPCSRLEESILRKSLYYPK